MLHVGNTVFDCAHRTEFSLLIGEKEERFGRKMTLLGNPGSSLVQSFLLWIRDVFREQEATAFFMAVVVQ